MRAFRTFGPLLLLSAILAVFASVYAVLGQELPEGVLALFGTVQMLYILYW